MQSAASDLSLIESAIREGGAIARAAYGKKVKAWHKSEDQPVTEVDLAVNALLEERLRGARPEYGWLSEETADTSDRLSRRRVFVIDPIDGTRSFMAGKPQFTICAGVVENGRAIAGGVYNPITEEMFLGASGFGATLNGMAITGSPRAELEGATLFAYQRVLERSPGWPRVEFAKRHSIAYRLALVAAGQADGAILYGFKAEWDIAPGAAIVEAAGARIATPKGEVLRFNQPVPRVPGAIAAGPLLFPQMLERSMLFPEPT